MHNNIKSSYIKYHFKAYIKNQNLGILTFSLTYTFIKKKKTLYNLEIELRA